MNSSIFIPQKKNPFRSLHYSPKNQQKNKQNKINGDKIGFKPEFLYFTHRQRQKINLFQNTQPNFFQNKSNIIKNSRQLEIDQKFGSCFQRNFKTRSKYFDVKRFISLKDKNKKKQIFLKNSKQTSFLIEGKSKPTQGKPKPTLKKKVFFNKNQVPSVGIYNAKPQILMKRMAKNEVFRKGKSCHQITISKKENNQSYYEKHFDFECLRVGQKEQAKTNKIRSNNKKKGTLVGLISHCQQQVKKGQKYLQQKLKIRCFDMGRQTSRFSIKTLRSKHQQLDSGNDYIQKTYNRTIFMPKTLNQAQLQTIYDKKKQKYQIQASCGILKHIKLKDFIKTYRKQTIDEQNFQ